MQADEPRYFPIRHKKIGRLVRFNTKELNKYLTSRARIIESSGKVDKQVGPQDEIELL